METVIEIESSPILPLVYGPTYITTRLYDEWTDDMTDETYAEMFRGMGEARDVDHNRNMILLSDRIAKHTADAIAFVSE